MGVDTWWQTETGGVAIAPRPSPPGAPLRPGKPQRPMFGMNPVILDSDGRPLEGPSVSGALCLGTPWPGIARTVHGDHQRFVDTYFSIYKGYYFTGDGALRDEGGFYQITGRMDDVINVTGHRLGTAEVEDALMEHPAVAEAAVVGFPHEVKGEGVYAYVILKEGCEEEVKRFEAVGEEQDLWVCCARLHPDHSWVAKNQVRENHEEDPEEGCCWGHWGPGRHQHPR